MSCGRFQGPSKLKCKKNTCSGRTVKTTARQWGDEAVLGFFRVYFKRGEGKKENEPLCKNHRVKRPQLLLKQDLF